MRREESAAAQLWRVVDVLDDGARDAEAVVRRGTPADLVEDDEAPVRRLTKDRSSFGHLHHERRHPAAQIVVGADPCEYAVARSNACPGRGHEGTDLRQQHDDRHLTQIG